MAGIADRIIPAGEIDGSFDYLVAGGVVDPGLPYGRPGFNFVVLALDTTDATVGFDNFVAGIAPVPEPGIATLMGLGLLTLMVGARRRS